MTETLTGTDRSAGVSYAELLGADTRAVPDHLARNSPMAPGPTLVPVERYVTQQFHDLEVAKVWRRVWQMACHEDHIPDPGDYHEYTVADLSFLIVRTDTGEIKAYWNACLHRGRKLREGSGKGAHDLRCAFHGWCWELDGAMKEVPCHWDFPHVEPEAQSLPEVQVDTWGGFVFINPDLDAESFPSFIGDLDSHFSTLPYERRYIASHVEKVLRCNWKVAQEAFMEAYHVIATHPNALNTIGDANTQYDVFGNYSRAISPSSIDSPHLHDAPAWDPLPDESATKMRHPLSGAVYERRADGRVIATNPDGRRGVFERDASWVEGELHQADPHMCDWLGGVDAPEMMSMSMMANMELPEGMTRRVATAIAARDAMRPVLGDEVEKFCDAECQDAIYFTLFPNFHPWGSFAPIVYRFRPYGSNPEMCVMEIINMAPYAGDTRPGPAAVIRLGPDDDWKKGIGEGGAVFNQDSRNMPIVQQGLHSKQQPIQLGNYGETKIRHFHQLLEAWISAP